MRRSSAANPSSAMNELISEHSIWDRANGALDLLSGMIEAQALIAYARPKAGDAIPVIIIAGFLGAGKSTLLRQLLGAAGGKRIAAVVNDFAALNIDAALIAETSADTIALQNGCICCSLSGGMARSLLAIAERSERPDLIAIEASGVSDPASIAQIIGTLPGVFVDSIVAVVDASAAPVTAEIAELHQRQISSADIILLNKADLISDEEAQERVLSLRRAVPRATVIRTTQGAVPLKVLLDFMHEQKAPGPAFIKDGQNELFQSVALAVKQPLDRRKFEHALSTLPDAVLRLKGFVRFANDPGAVWLVQAVGCRWRIESCALPPDALGLVAIGLRMPSFDAVIEQHLLFQQGE